MICKYCEHSFSGNYCNNCGQSFDVRKIDARYLLDEIPNSILQLNRGILFTIIQLFKRPGHSIRDFLEGKRKPYSKPIAFLLITSALYVLSASLFDKATFTDYLIIGWKKGMVANNETSGFDILNWISKNQTYIILLILPFFSLASYISFIKSKYNYFEHLVLNIYITGQQLFIYFVFSFFFYQDNALLAIPIVTGMTYNFWTYSQFFNDKKKFTKLGLMILTYVIFIMQFLIASIITSAIRLFIA